tara:strand:+ start:585 stop:767 length:183 start_codon:yes stop_codon:yes gene_type:complete
MQNFSEVEKEYFEGNFNNYVVTLTDGTKLYVPLEEGNKDYNAIQQWIADGNTVIDNGGGE